MCPPGRARVLTDQRLTKLNHKVTDQQLTELIFGLAMPTYGYSVIRNPSIYRKSGELQSFNSDGKWTRVLRYSYTIFEPSASLR